MIVQIQARSDTLANFTATNPVLAQGEPAYETDTKRFRFGDGISNYVDLPVQSVDTALMQQLTDDAIAAKEAAELARDEAVAAAGGGSQATTEVPGVVELATNEEAEAGVEPLLVVTTTGLAAALAAFTPATPVEDATTTVKGIVELATTTEAEGGTDNVRAVTPAGVAAAISALGVATPDATETVKGKVELSTSAEAIAGSDTARALTPANLAAVLATKGGSTTAAGFLELATTAEVQAGTSTTLAATPAGVAAAIAAIPAVPAASQTASGIIEIATNTEVATGTDAVRAVTPAGLNSVMVGKLDTSPTAGSVLSRNTATGNIVEVLSGSNRIWARSRSTGQQTFYGLPKRETLDWYEGDTDPTSIIALPTWVHVRAHLSESASIPAWVLARESAEIVRITSGGGPGPVTYEFEWDGLGLANGSAVGAGTAGTGDTTGGWTGLFAGTPTMITGQTKTPMIHFVPAANAQQLFRTITPGTERRVKFWYHTPTTWPTAAFQVARIRNGATEDCVFLLQQGTGQVGAFRVSNSTGQAAAATANNLLSVNSWYRIEFSLVQNATAANGEFQLEIFDIGGTRIYNSGRQVDTNGIGFGTTHDRFYLGNNAAVTVTGGYDLGLVRITNDADIPIGV